MPAPFSRFSRIGAGEKYCRESLLRRWALLEPGLLGASSA